MSLLEVLACVLLLAVTINVLMSAGAAAWRMSSVGTEALDRLRGVREVERAFRACVRGAAGMVPAAGRFTTGPDCIVLRHAARPDTFIVFGKVEEATRLGWLEIRRHEAGWETAYLRRFAQPFSRAEFSCPTPQTARLDLVVQYDAQEKPAAPPVYRVIAAPRNRGDHAP
jgi:hypothetical protein